jgi:hypothetical protein
MYRFFQALGAYPKPHTIPCFEIARPIEIGNQPGLLRLPTQQFPSSLTRGRAVDRCETRKPAKVVGGFLRGLADDRHVQTAADHASDVSERHTFIGDPMIPGCRHDVWRTPRCESSSVRVPEALAKVVSPVSNKPSVDGQKLHGCQSNELDPFCFSINAIQDVRQLF